MDQLLEISNLHKSFGGIKAIDGISLSLTKGEILGIIGPNGSGKTTLINLISGIYPPDQGQIVFKGRDTKGLKPNQLVRLGLTRTFQATVLYSEVTVLENVLRGAHLTLETGFFHMLFHSKKARQREKQALEKVMKHLALVGLGKMMDQGAKNLPYGNQKALGVALGLSTDPDLLMLDEPAAGLNPEEASEMRGTIKKINDGGGTLIVVDHNMRFIMPLCDRIIVLHYGEKISEGTPQVIQNDDEVIKAYLGRE